MIRGFPGPDFLTQFDGIAESAGNGDLDRAELGYLDIGGIDPLRKLHWV